MDLRQLITQFEVKEQLRHIKVPVNPELELAALCRQEFTRPAGAALLFEQLDGYQFSSVANLFGSEQRMAHILRCQDFQSFQQKLHLAFEKENGAAAERCRNLAATHALELSEQPPLWKSRSAATLNDLPAVKSWPLETKPYFTLPLVITSDLETGVQNLGIYRVQRLTRRQGAINIHPRSGAGAHLAKAQQFKQKLPVALVFGSDPALYWLAAAALPVDCDEFGLYSAVFSENLALCKGVSQDLNLPAAAEFVVEGTISPTATCHEGPFGNHTGSYVERSDCPLLELTSVAWREQALMPLTVVGPPPSENVYLGRANEILLRELLQIDFPQVNNLRMPLETIFHGTSLLTISSAGIKANRELIDNLWADSPLRNAKLIILLDDDIQLESFSQCWWRTINQLEANRIYQDNGRIAIDATGVDSDKLVVDNQQTIDLIHNRRREYDH